MRIIRFIFQGLKWGVLAVVAADVLFVYLAGLASHESHLDQTGLANCIVVYAAGPGDYLGRVQHAITLYKEGKAPVLILPRKQEFNRRDAYVASMLASQNIPDTAIYWSIGDRKIEDVLSYTRKIMFLQNWTTCLVSTDPWYTKKTLIVTKSLKMKNVLISPAWESPAYRSFFWRGLYTLVAGQDLVWWWWGHVLGHRDRDA